MLTSVQAANWWTLCDQCSLSVIHSVILSISLKLGVIDCAYQSEELVNF